jgi:hypothetical protein
MTVSSPPNRNGTLPGDAGPTLEEPWPELPRWWFKFACAVSAARLRCPKLPLSLSCFVSFNPER